MRPVNRRSFLAAMTAVPAATFAQPETHPSFAELEARYGGGLGVAVPDTEMGRWLTYRAH